jgi:hypothetical protein
MTILSQCQYMRPEHNHVTQTASQGISSSFDLARNKLGKQDEVKLTSFPRKYWIKQLPDAAQIKSPSIARA